MPALVQLTMLFAYCVSSGFFYVYDIAVDSMLICFIVVSTRTRTLRVWLWCVEVAGLERVSCRGPPRPCPPSLAPLFV